IRDFHVTGVQTCALPIFVGTDVVLRLVDRVVGVRARPVADPLGAALAPCVVRHTGSPAGDRTGQALPCADAAAQPPPDGLAADEERVLVLLRDLLAPLDDLAELQALAFLARLPVPTDDVLLWLRHLLLPSCVELDVPEAPSEPLAHDKREAALL